MTKVSMCLAASLIALPILAAPKPTPTPAAKIKGRGLGIAAHKEGAPGTPMPTVGPVGNTNLNSGRTNISRQGTPGTPTPTAGPVGGIEQGNIPVGATERDKLKGTTKTEGAPTPTAGPVPNDGREKQKGTSNVGREKHPKIKSTTSNGSLKAGEGAPGTPSPTVGPVSATTVNGSKSNSFKEGQPTRPPTCARLVNGKIEHYPCPEGAEAQKLHPDLYKRESAPGTPTPTAGPVGNINLNSGRTNIERQGIPVTPIPTAGPVPNDGREKQKGTSKTNLGSGRQAAPKYVAGRVLSQQGRRLTVQLGDGQTVVIDSSGLNPAPRVGSTVTVTNSRGNWVIVLR